MRKTLLLFGIGAVLLAIGILASRAGIETLQNAAASENWPTAEGKIISSEVEKQTHTSTTTRGRYSETRVVTTTKYVPKILYEYSVGGIRYSASRISFIEYSSDNSGHIEPIVSKYPEGKTVSVYYDPDGPEVAVLEAGVSGQTYLPLTAGIIFGVAGILMLAGNMLRVLRSR